MIIKITKNLHYSHRPSLEQTQHLVDGFAGMTGAIK